jgi:outer membrane lipoprotein carrier protein
VLYRFLGLMLISCIVLCTTSASGEDDAAVRLAGRVEDLHAQAKTFRASFRQTFVHRASKKKTVSSGRVAAAEDALFSFRYASPAGNRVVSDGTLVRAYERAEKTMYVMRLTRAKEAMGVAFLLGSIKLTKHFSLRIIPTDKPAQGIVLEAIPKAEDPLVARLILYVDPPTAQVLRVMVIDAQGNTNRFEFTERAYGVELPDGEFTFKPPRGTKVVTP